MTNVILTFVVVALGAAAFWSIIWIAERKARAERRQEEMEEAQRRLRDAIEADARGRERIARGELLNNDGYRRD